MSETNSVSRPRLVLACAMLLVGAGVFAIRLQHAGPYAMPDRGNLLSGVLAILSAGWLARAWWTGRRIGTAATWATLAASPIVFFFALYAILAELEEVVVLKAFDRSGQSADLRLWVVDHDGANWVTMPRTKADAHALGEGTVALMRRGEVRCVVATRHSEQELVDKIHHLRDEKYSIQRLATLIGLFGEDADPSTITLRLSPCPSG